MPYKNHSRPRNTSWQQSSKWYNRLVGSEGHYYHQHIVLPGILRLLDIKTTDSVLDLGCGQGILARKLPREVEYVGVDAARSLIEAAKKQDKHPRHHYQLGNSTTSLNFPHLPFSHITLILALQNMKDPQGVFQNAARYAKAGTKLIIVLNHPCFRIPRQSGWDIDEKTKQQYRWINRYMTPLEIPITTHPGKERSAITWSFHYPLSTYTQLLAKSGFVIQTIEEWVSDKVSEGKASKMENRARSDIPIFMTIVARYIPV